MKIKPLIFVIPHSKFYKMMDDLAMNFFKNI